MKRVRSSECLKTEKKVKLDDVFASFPNWFAQEWTYFKFKDKEFSTQNFWMGYNQWKKGKIFYFLNKYPFVVCLDQNEVVFLPLNHDKVVTLQHQTSSIPVYPKRKLDPNPVWLKIQLRRWLKAPTWLEAKYDATLEEGWETQHPFQPSQTIRYQVSPQLLEFFVKAINFYAFSHYTWCLVEVDQEEHAQIQKYGFYGSPTTVYPWDSWSSARCSVLGLIPWRPNNREVVELEPVSPIPVSRHGIHSCCGRFILPVGYFENRRWGSKGRKNDQLNFPIGMTIYQDEIYIADYCNNRVQVWDTKGHFRRNWRGITGVFVDGPSDVAVYDDQVYVVDQNNHRLQVFTSQGEYLRQWGQKGLGTDEFCFPNSVTVGYDDSQDQPLVFVSNRKKTSVQVFQKGGTFVHAFETDDYVGCLVYHEGLVYVAKQNTRCVAVFTPEGTLIREWGGPYQYQDGEETPFQPGCFCDIQYIVVKKNRVWVAEWNRIQAFDHQGNFKRHYKVSSLITSLAFYENYLYFTTMNGYLEKILA